MDGGAERLGFGQRGHLADRRRDVVAITVKRPQDQFKSVASSALLANSCLSSLHCGSAGSLLSLKAVQLEQVKIPSRCLTSLVGLQVNFRRKEKAQTLPYLLHGGSL